MTSLRGPLISQLNLQYIQWFNVTNQRGTGRAWGITSVHELLCIASTFTVKADLNARGVVINALQQEQFWRVVANLAADRKKWRSDIVEKQV